ncbi:unnamed protein product [Tuber aestivum]|uniref:Uncharacterized protein n=1 Tax=Tuber aestivum TaxID=59557 RepID=A0A292Q0K2_9PEZI|nr:unnamed protein product [Tuber aestivum]
MMNLSIEDLQIIRRHSIRSLRGSYRQIFISSTGLEAKDVQQKPEILNLMLKSAAVGEGCLTNTEASDYRSVLRILLDSLASSTAAQELRYPDSSDRSTQHRILLFTEEWPRQLDMNSNVLGLCKDALVKALSPDTDVPDADLWCSVYSLLRTLHFMDSDLRVIEENSLRNFLVTYRQQFRASYPKFFLRTAGRAMKLHGNTETLGLLLGEAIQEGRELQLVHPYSRCSIDDKYHGVSEFNRMFSIFLQELALNGASAELRHPIRSCTSIRQRILLFAEEWPHQLASNGITLALCKDALLKALTPGSDKEFWYCMYKLLDSFYFSGSELGVIGGNPLRDFRSNYRLFFLEKTETTIERVIENPEILKSMLKNATVHERKLYPTLPHAARFLAAKDTTTQLQLAGSSSIRLALTDASRELRHPMGSQTCTKQRIMLLVNEWPNQLVLNDKVLDLCADALLKALIPEADVSDRELWYSVYHLLNALHFSELDLQLIRETPLQDFRRTYRRFFLETSSLEIEKVLENPATLRSVLVDSGKGESLEWPPNLTHVRSRTTGSGSHELFHVFLCQMALTEVSGELKHPVGSSTTVGKRILLFAAEWPGQLDLSGDVLSLCTDVLVKALSPEEEVSDIELWYSMYHLLNAFPAVESPGADRNIAAMVKDYAVRYAKEHPYLLALNVGLTVAGLVIPPFLGVLGFTRAGVGAGSAAAAWQSSLGVVAKGSLFSFCQSIGATGSASMVMAASNISWAVGGLTALWDGFGKGGDEGEEGDEGDEGDGGDESDGD